jgi:hypothetical protein
VLAISFSGVALAADDVPDLGPPLRQCEKMDCKCVQSSIDRHRKIAEGYRNLAEEYRGMLTSLGTRAAVRNPKARGQAADDTPTWADLSMLDPSQKERLLALKGQFGKDEAKMVKEAPERDCGFPPDAEIVLVTSSLTGSPPSKADQEKYKPLFPCEGVYDAVMKHEYHHADKWSANNQDKVDKAPRVRTPYGQALEEAEGNEIEVAELEKLKATLQCDPRAEGSSGNRGLRLAQIERVRRAKQRVASYAATIS